MAAVAEVKESLYRGSLITNQFHVAVDHDRGSIARLDINAPRVHLVERAVLLREKVLVLDPNNLPALYRMMNIYQNISEEAAAQFAVPLRERLRNVDTAQVTLPDEPRLAAYVQETAAALVQEGIWTPEQAAGILGP